MTLTNMVGVRCCFKLLYAIVVLILLHMNNPCIGCRERERQALLALQQGLGAEDGDPSLYWGREAPNKDCCEWDGVHCSNQTGHVVKLELYGFQGKISPKLIELQHLEYLDLSYNNFSQSQIPDFIGSLSNLRYLDLSNANFGGLIPYQLGNLTNLEYLDLGCQYDPSSCTYSKNLYWLPNLSRLKYLDLSFVNLSDVVGWLEAVNMLPKLTNLTLQMCNLPPPVISSVSLLNSSKSLQGKISPKLIELQHLEYLDLSYNNFSRSQIPDFIGSLSNLRYLDLSFANFSGLIPYQLGNLTNLEYLDLGCRYYLFCSPNLYAKNLNWLPNLSRLKYLDLSFVNLSDVVGWLEAVNMLPKLTNLALRECNLPHPVISSVSHLNSSKSLVHVDLYNNSLDSSIFQLLPGPHPNLVYLDLSENKLSGRIPESIGQMSNLVDLDLSENKLSGRIPESIGQMSNLEFIDLHMNSFEGVISETHFSKLSKLRILDLSSNSLVLNFSFDWVPPFQLRQIRLGSCKMGPYFPKWLRTQKSYNRLDISDAGISDTIPTWFWDLRNEFVYKDLSRNQIRGNLRSELACDFLNVSWNQLEGPIPSILSSVSLLDLSNNKFSGLGSLLCTSTTENSNLEYLDLSSNHVSGDLPDCWIHFQMLIFLDLSNNSLFGKIPTTMGYLFRIETLKLNNNRFVGELPSQLKNCTMLTLVNVGENKLSGLIPEWLGENLLNLAIIILRSNQFYRSIPPQLCHLTHLQILDLSMNNISGTIPKCLNNWTTLAKKGTSTLTMHHQSFLWDYIDEEYVTWKGVRSKYKNTLGLVKSIDLSCNKLSGEIPTEVTYLVGLISLNLSRNQLTGQIPSRIGNLQELDSLDLSRNQINGTIPISISRINRIGYLDLSENNLSGKIPEGTQLQTFDSAYGGNPLLYGEPLGPCSEEEKGPRQSVLVNEDDKDGLITQGFYISMGLGFAVGFWGVCGTLLVNRSCRYTYFNFLTFLNDWLYVKVEIIKQRIRNK